MAGARTTEDPRSWDDSANMGEEYGIECSEPGWTEPTDCDPWALKGVFVRDLALSYWGTYPKSAGRLLLYRKCTV